MCELIALRSSLASCRVTSSMLQARLRDSSEVEVAEVRSKGDEYCNFGVNSKLPILAVGRVSDIKVLGHAFSDGLEADQQKLCYAMVDKIVKRSNKLIKELQDGEDAGKPRELKKLAWKFPGEEEEGCFLVKVDEERTFIYIAFAMSRHYPEQLARDLFQELAEKVVSLFTDDDFVAEESVTHSLLQKMSKLVQSYETTNFETYVRSVERRARRATSGIQVNVAPPSRPTAGRAWTCARKVMIYTILVGMLVGGIYLVLHFTVFAKKGSAQASSALIV